jgi:TIR domain
LSSGGGTSNTSKSDKVSFPGGYDLGEILAAVSIAATVHVDRPEFGTTEQALLQRFLTELVARHPESAPFRNFGDPYQLRIRELFDERLSLLNSHLKASWFGLAYWTYGLVAVRSGLSIAEVDDLRTLMTPVRLSLRELGIRVSNEECLAEIDRFMPPEVTQRNVLGAALLFLSFVRFLHNGALRRREVVTPRLIPSNIYFAFAQADAKASIDISTFLTSHGVSISQQPADITQASRLLVLLSKQAMASEVFWRSLADWKERQVNPMVVCLMPKAELYREPPTDWRSEIWKWLAANVAVELTSEKDRYLTLLRALDVTDPKQWWWGYGDTIELGLAVDVLRLGVPRPATVSAGSGPTGEAYPFSIDGSVFAACLVASDHQIRGETSGPDTRYIAICNDLLQLRRRANGEPYGLPWFVLIYRTWLAFAAKLTGFAYSGQDADGVREEMRLALFALGVGTTDAAELDGFLEGFANLPWAVHSSPVAAVDERTIAFVTLIFDLTQAALTRNQRMRLRHSSCPAFVSYAREDEAFARDLVVQLEGKGADVWWDLNAITLGTPLDQSLRSAVSGSRYLLLIATPAAGKSEYVRLEIETAVRNGLRIVPVVPDGQIPVALQSLLDSAGGTTEPVTWATDSAGARIAASILSRLERSALEQLEWLQGQTTYQNFRQQLARVRSSLA